MSRHFHLCHFVQLLLVGMLLFVVSACGRSERAEVPNPGRSVYYWRQELTLSADEREFLAGQQVRKLYLHLFDVVREGGELRPRATLTVSEPVPDGVEVIPVVFLANNVMSDTTGLAALPQLICRRVDDFMQQNDLGRAKELQIDFDWTQRNQTRYFGFLNEVKNLWQGKDEAFRTLSTTIRLHQLGMQTPPVDYGTLMVYNLGRIQDPSEPNSILTTELLKPYLRNLKGYSLPLCVALPVYSWDLLFHADEFQCIVRGIDVKDTARFEPIDDVHYRAIEYQPIPPGGVSMRGDGRIYPGDIIRHEQVSAQELQDVRALLEEHRPSACSQIILYHLDEKQLKQYTQDELQTLYTGR